MALLDTSKIIVLISGAVDIYNELRVALEYREMHEDGTPMPVLEVKRVVSTLIDGHLRGLHSMFKMDIPENDAVDWKVIAEYVNNEYGNGHVPEYVPPVSRGALISQLRHALYLAESPSYDAFEFDLGNTDFSFEFEENSHPDS